MPIWFLVLFVFFLENVVTFVVKRCFRASIKFRSHETIQWVRFFSFFPMFDSLFSNWKLKTDSCSHLSIEKWLVFSSCTFFFYFKFNMISKILCIIKTIGLPDDSTFSPFDRDAFKCGRDQNKIDSTSFKWNLFDINDGNLKKIKEIQFTLNHIGIFEEFSKNSCQEAQSYASNCLRRVLCWEQAKRTNGIATDTNSVIIGVRMGSKWLRHTVCTAQQRTHICWVHWI